ncbi:MAG: Jag N-terminal domain-containing protein [Desulfuromonadales bacterium]|nr:Jag N-terminal domain-containing protein [Desulfuromonadales bacterium]
MNQQSLHVEVTAKSLDAAVEQALAQLNCTRAEADIEVLQVHSTGLLGIFGRRQARVIVKLHDRGVIARQLTNQLLSLSDLDASLDLVSSSNQIELLLTAQDPSFLIGRHGQTLDALQSLVGTMTDRLTTDRTPIFLDVDGYRGRRRDFLNRLARNLSQKVRKSGKPASTPPLVLSERRILHELFNQESDLESRSKNHEGGRKIIILQTRG